MSSSRKTSLQDFQHQIKDIKSQLLDQGKCLEHKTETQVAILHEVQDFLKKRAEIDLEYSAKLDKLVKSAMLKHKSDRQKRANWPLYSTCTLWQQLVDGTKDEAKQRGITAEVYGEHVNHSITARCTALNKISKRCREIGVLAHGEIARVLHELAVAMKTYQTSYDEFSTVTAKYQQAEQTASKYNDPTASTVSSRKKKAAQKSRQKVREKYMAAKNKCDRARNEYLLCIDAANSALHKFFADDVSDLIDCSDLGMEHWLNLILCNVIAARKAACQMEMNSLANLDSFKESLTTQLDKRRFFECNSAAYMLPRQFEFKSEPTEHVNSISLDDGLRGELRERQVQIKKRLGNLHAESDATWKTLEDTETGIKAALNAMISMEITEFGIAEQNRPRGENLDGELGKLTEAYLHSFNYYLLNSNLIARLEARHDGIGNALINNPYSDQQQGPQGQDCENNHATPGTNGGEVEEEMAEYYRRKRLGSRQTSITTSTDPTTGAPSQSSPKRRRARLFGGSLEEYVQSTGEAIPLIVTSCIRVLSRFALHHQGIFRVSGSQVEINNFKDAFEVGEDPLRSVQDGSDVNSIAGVLKLFLRELREPLFPIYLFDLLTECAKCASNPAEFISQISPLMSKLPRPNYLLLRYLFAFLNHLSEFSDENMMDTYNLAICFGPTLLPIPEGKDQVYYQNYVNELVKNLIVHCDLIFASRVLGPRYTKYQTMDAIAAAALSAERSDIDTFVDESDSALELPGANNHTGTSGSGSTARVENISDMFDMNSLSNGPSSDARAVAMGNGEGGEANYSFGPLRLAPMTASINSHSSMNHNFAAGRVHPAQQQQARCVNKPLGAVMTSITTAATYTYSSSEENLSVINSVGPFPPVAEASHTSPHRRPPTGRMAGSPPPGRLPTRYNSVDHYQRGGQSPLANHRQQSHEPELKSYTFLRSPIKSSEDSGAGVVMSARQHSPQRVTSPKLLTGSVNASRDAFLRHFQSASLDIAAGYQQLEPTTNGGHKDLNCGGSNRPLRIPVAPKPPADSGGDNLLAASIKSPRNVIVGAAPPTYNQLYTAMGTSSKRQLPMTSPTALTSPNNVGINIADNHHLSMSTAMVSSASYNASSKSSPARVVGVSSTASSTTSTAKSEIVKAEAGAAPAALPPHGRAGDSNRRVDV